MSRSAVVLCPGRGSYTASELGYLSRPAPATAIAELHDAVARADRRRARRGDRTVADLDRSPSFDAVFFRGENAAALTFACTAFDYLRLDAQRLEIVAVGGNSMGWYSALYAAGVLGIDDTFELVETMGGMSRDGLVGGQVIYPIVGDDWQIDAAASTNVDAALQSARAAGHDAGWSIRYAGYAVLWGDDGGTPHLLDALPEVKRGSRKYPQQLPGHSAFHSPLMYAASEGGRAALSRLPWRAPAVALIDGRGAQWHPLTTDPDLLSTYTLEDQVLTTFDFTSMVRVALREFAPDLLVLLGPGDTLGAAVAQVIVTERWQGIDSREAFVARQASDPLLVSMARTEQAQSVLLPPD